MKDLLQQMKNPCDSIIGVNMKSEAMHQVDIDCAALYTCQMTRTVTECYYKCNVVVFGTVIEGPFLSYCG